MKLTCEAVKALALPESGQMLVYDTVLRGFGVRLTKGARMYIVEARVAGRKERKMIAAADDETLLTARDKTIQRMTAKDARIAARTALADMANRPKPTATAQQQSQETASIEAPEPITLEAAIKTFFAGRKLKASTEADYRHVFDKYFKDWQPTQLNDITPQQVLKRFQKLSAESGEATANKAMRILGSLWNHARASTAGNDGTHVLRENPVKRIGETKSWHKIGRRQTYLTATDLPGWFTAVRGLTSELNQHHADAFKDYLELLLRTGMRRSEAANLRWRDINMVAKTFTIVAPKNSRDLTLPMSDQIHQIFERRKLATDERDVTDEGNVTEPVPFPGARGGTLSDPRKFLAPIRKASGTTFTFHDLRRSFAVIADSLDLSHYSLKRLLNHVDDDVTMGYLVHDPERLREPMQRISDRIDVLAKLTPAPAQADPSEESGATSEPELMSINVAT